MTQSGYANAIVDAMLSWLKGLASWVLKLFDLSSGYSPLKFLANNWLKLLVMLLIIGVVVDLLVWLIRWRPHWVWFHKKRVIINDKNFFNQEKQRDVQAQAARGGARPRRNWEDSEYVVPGAARRRREEMARREEQLRLAREKRLSAGEPKDVFQDELFDVNAEKKSSDTYEDAVFSVSNLPKPEPEMTGQTVRSGRMPAARRGSNSTAAQRNRGQATRRSKPQGVRTMQARTGMKRGQKRPTPKPQTRRETQKR